MKCILSHSRDPYFNLAAEEYLLKHAKENYYLQYINENAVVVGKHQNTLSEIDQRYLEENSITLARRISGGGAVYHDSGNLNYSFITTEEPGNYIRFKAYTAPVISALRSLGISASLGTRNEILAGERKISGTASHVYKNRVLHHGTILFDANLERLSRCLYVDPNRYKDKGVKSVRSEVVNIKGMMNKTLQMSDFSVYLRDYIVREREGEVHDFSRLEIEAIQALRDEKFVHWEWNYGYSPAYEFDRKIELASGTAWVHVSVKKGIISEVVFSGEGLQPSAVIEEAVKGLYHEPVQLKDGLQKVISDKKMIDKILEALF